MSKTIIDRMNKKRDSLVEDANRKFELLSSLESKSKEARKLERQIIDDMISCKALSDVIDVLLEE